MRGGGLSFISQCHPMYTPLHYVLLFPRGETGWHPLIPMGAAGSRSAHVMPGAIMPTDFIKGRTALLQYSMQVAFSNSLLLMPGLQLSSLLWNGFVIIRQSFVQPSTRQRSRTLKMMWMLITEVTGLFSPLHIWVVPGTCSSLFKIQWLSVDTAENQTFLPQ